MSLSGLAVLLLAVFSFELANAASKTVESRATDSIFASADRAQNLKHFLFIISSSMPEEDYEYLVAQIGDANPKLPKFKRNGENSYTVASGNYLVPIELLSAFEGKFKINNKLFSHDPQTPMNKTYDKIKALLPTQTAHLYDLFIPPAYAGIKEKADSFIAVALSALAAVTGYDANCNYIKKFETNCQATLSELQTIVETDQEKKENFALLESFSRSATGLSSYFDEQAAFQLRVAASNEVSKARLQRFNSENYNAFESDVRATDYLRRARNFEAEASSTRTQGSQKLREDKREFLQEHNAWKAERFEFFVTNYHFYEQMLNTPYAKRANNCEDPKGTLRACMRATNAAARIIYNQPIARDAPGGGQKPKGARR